MHLNDYPQAADSSTLNDGNRIYPGDGVAPLRQILRDLRDNGFRGYLSLELFNKEVLGPQRRREPQNRDGEDPRHGPGGDGLAGWVDRFSLSRCIHVHGACGALALRARTTRRYDDNDVKNATGHVGRRGHLRECPPRPISAALPRWRRRRPERPTFRSEGRVGSQAAGVGESCLRSDRPSLLHRAKRGAATDHSPSK